MASYNYYPSHYPDGLIKLQGYKNYDLWRSEILLFLESVDLLDTLLSGDQEEEFICSFSCNQNCKRVAARLAVFLLTSIDKEIHKHLLCDNQEEKRSSVKNPWDIWRVLESLFLFKI